jgi:D-alanine-D-alanine ligase-like ATP-grasp enzyme
MNKTNDPTWEELYKKLKNNPSFLSKLDEQIYRASGDKFYYILEKLLQPIVVRKEENNNITSPIVELLNDAISVSNSILYDNIIDSKIYKIQNITNYLSNNPFILTIIHEAHNESKTILLINPINFTIQIGSGKNSIWISNTATNNESYLSTLLCHDKVSSHYFIEKLSYPQPKQELLTNKTNLTKISLPCVIKPICGNKGKDVIVNINILEQLKRKSFEFLLKYSIGIIQEQVFGNDYRLVVINGKLDFIIMRDYPNVIGDGKSNIKKLIKEKNDQLVNFSSIHGISGFIISNNSLLDMLSLQGYNLESVPKCDEKIILSRVANISQGGTRTEISLNDIHPEVKNMVEMIATTSRVYTLGVDIISKDITKSLEEGETKVIEVNTNPEFIQQRAVEYYNKLTKDKSIEIQFEELDLSHKLNEDYHIVIHKNRVDVIKKIINLGYADKLIIYDNINQVLLNPNIEYAYFI